MIEKHLPLGKRRSGQKLLGVKFIVAHDTGNPNSTALGNVSYYTNTFNLQEQSAHVFIDDQNVVECVPLNEKAWHVRRDVPTDNSIYGVDANDYALSVELCYFPQDVARSKMAYNAYVEYIKGLCQKYDLNPAKSVIGHYKLDPGRRTDPINAFKTIGKTWEQFLIDLAPEVLQPSEKEQIKEKIISYIRGL